MPAIDLLEVVADSMLDNGGVMRKSLLVAGFLALGWISIPAQAVPCPGVTPWVFDDVLDTDPFCAYITDVANRGVTLGCQIIDANHRLYCPSTAVPREQMAAFLSRLASNLFPSTCSAGQVLKWNGAAWACANDTSSGGTVTSLSQGSGIVLNPNPIIATGTIMADTAYLQRRVSGSCIVGASIRAIAADGTVVCQADTNSGGTVTSITAGAGLFGGTITSSGTINLTTTQLLPLVACSTGFAPHWNGSAWACADPSNFTGNITLQNSASASVGNIMKGGTRFIHNYGNVNTFVGEFGGNFTMTGSNNAGFGFGALQTNTTGSSNTAIGTAAMYFNTSGEFNTASGFQSLYVNTMGSSNTATGYSSMNFNTIGQYLMNY